MILKFRHSSIISEKPGYLAEKLKTRSFWFLQITQDVNKIKKILNILLYTLVIGNVCEVSGKNIELYGSWSLSKFSIFQTKNLVSRKQ